MTFVRLEPSTLVIAMARTRAGSDSRMSMARIVRSSTHPPQKPARTPDVPPSARRSRAPPSRAGGARPGTATARDATPGSVIADPRIQGRVEDVDDQVHEHEADGEEHHRALHHGVVALVDTVQEHPAQPGQTE